MIEGYFDALEKLLRDFPIIQSYTLTKKLYNIYQGYAAGIVSFEHGYSLHFTEVMDAEVGRKLKYRYQCLDAGQGLVFRYDNAPHHPEVATFPHHKHAPMQIEPSAEPTLEGVLLEISRIIQKEAQKKP